MLRRVNISRPAKGSAAIPSATAFSAIPPQPTPSAPPTGDVLQSVAASVARRADRGPDPGLASSTLSAALISGRPDMAAAMMAVLREALPMETVLGHRTAAEALPRVAAECLLGRAPAVFLLDFRGLPVAELAAQARQVRQAHADAEIIVLAESRDAAAFTACLQSAGPGRLTFLLVPFHPRHAVETIRAAADRYRLLAEAVRNRDSGMAAHRMLELQVQELRARLDVAKHAARHDDLTGVLNRTGFMEELNTRLNRDDRAIQTVLMIDLDRFKAVNDTMGHGAGDELVRKICVGIASVIPSGSLLARLGGDEFGVIVEMPTEQGIDNLCAQILKTCNQARLIGGHEVQVSCSIGVARQGVTNSEVELMRQADLAMYAAKREGRNRCRVFDSALDQATKYQMSIESGLERALRSGQFAMVYQPIVEGESRRILGFEALVRWDSPEHGAISPAEFIPIAEETGLILDIGDWIARQALKDCRRWNGPYVSINLSARQFLRHNVGERILRYAADANVPPERVQIELTETAIIDDVERADYNLRLLLSAGVRVALDDFGTGYSSLVYLNQFAIDSIKIDKSFVDDITRDRQSAVIVASLAKLARSLGMGVIAEGVETEAQRQVLLAAGCGAFQGFHFSKPMSAREVSELPEVINWQG